MVMVARPLWLAVGVMVKLRLELLPPKTMFASGTRPGLDESPLRIRALMAESGSPMVKGMGPVEPLTATVRLVMAGMTGGVPRSARISCGWLPGSEYSRDA